MTRNFFIFSLLISATLLQGCASLKPIPQENWQQMIKGQHFDESDQFHNYTQKTIASSPDEVISATHKLFEHIYKKPKFIDGENNTSVAREWYVWALLVAVTGYDYWHITATPSEEDPSSSLVTIALASNSSMQTAGVSSGSGNITKTFGGGGIFSSGAKLYKDEAAYQLFWSHLEYLLGINDTWVSCKEASDWRKENQYEGKLTALCQSAKSKPPISK